MCAELMVISGACSAHHHTGCKIPEQVDNNVNALWCVTVWPPLHRIHEGLRVWFSTLVVACFCWVMCFDITHILSNLRTNMTFKELDICGLQKGIILFPCNNVLFFLFSLFFFYVSHPFSISLSPVCSEWQLLQKPCWGPQWSQPQRSCPWPILVSDSQFAFLPPMHQVLFTIGHCQMGIVSHS